MTAATPIGEAAGAAAAELRARLGRGDGPAYPEGWCAGCQAPSCACPTCHGAGYFRRAGEATQVSTLAPCDCRATSRGAAAVDRAARLSVLPKMRALTFATFDGSLAGVGDALEAAQAFAAEPTGWLVLHGPPGVGKTHLAAAVGNAIAVQGTPVVMQVVPDLLDHLKATFQPAAPRSYDELFEAIKAVPVLVLDDFGQQKATDWAREKLFQLVDARYRDRLPLVITTNALGGIEPAVRDRLTDDGLAVVVRIDVPSYRQRPAQHRLRLVAAMEDEDR